MLAFVLGVCGVAEAGRHRWTTSISLFAFAGISVPVFWLALVMILVFAVNCTGCRPAACSTVGDGGLVDQIRHLIMPVITLALARTGQFTRFVRAA